MKDGDSFFDISDLMCHSSEVHLTGLSDKV